MPGHVDHQFGGGHSDQRAVCQINGDDIDRGARLEIDCRRTDADRRLQFHAELRRDAQVPTRAGLGGKADCQGNAAGQRDAQQTIGDISTDQVVQHAEPGQAGRFVGHRRREPVAQRPHTVRGEIGHVDRRQLCARSEADQVECGKGLVAGVAQGRRTRPHDAEHQRQQ